MSHFTNKNKRNRTPLSNAFDVRDDTRRRLDEASSLEYRPMPVWGNAIALAIFIGIVIGVYLYFSGRRSTEEEDMFIRYVLMRAL